MATFYREKIVLKHLLKYRFYNFHLHCLEETSHICVPTLKSLYSFLPPEDIQNCENGIFKEDTKLKCYMFCLLEEASLVSYLSFVYFSLHPCWLNARLIYF